MSRPEPVHISELAAIRMVRGGEQRHPTVIYNGVVKDWVGIGWIDLDEATPEDYEEYPEVYE